MLMNLLLSIMHEYIIRIFIAYISEDTLLNIINNTVKKYGCSAKFMIESLHTGMVAIVRKGGEVSDTFDITNSVK